MNIQTFTCPNCGDTLYSRTSGDFISCSCSDISVGEEHNCQKIFYNPSFVAFNDIENKNKKIDATKEELLSDFIHGSDKFGRISGKDKQKRNKYIKEKAKKREDRENKDKKTKKR